MKVFFVNKAISVLVDHVEGLLELLNLRLVKHSKHIGGGTLGALLGVLSLGPFARHVGSWWVPLTCNKDDMKAIDYHMTTAQGSIPLLLNIS